MYIKSEDENKRTPGLAAVRNASALLEKPKKAQDVHPLFGRGFDTKLSLRVRTAAPLAISRTEGRGRRERENGREGERQRGGVEGWERETDRQTDRDRERQRERETERERQRERETDRQTDR